LLRQSNLANKDFEEIFNNNKFTTNDFIFLDPPYDTEFSEYDQNSFSKEDQLRLAKCLYKTKAKFLMVIKETDFINSLYKNQQGLFVESFEKTYLYNIKGRNNRGVSHLIVSNYRI
jgi:DNA adenine methylase